MKRGLFVWCDRCGNWADLKPNGKDNHYECEVCKKLVVMDKETYERHLRRIHPPFP